jgi:hypothetical protein
MGLTSVPFSHHPRAANVLARLAWPRLAYISIPPYHQNAADTWRLRLHPPAASQSKLASAFGRDDDGGGGGAVPCRGVVPLPRPLAGAGEAPRRAPEPGDRRPATVLSLR